MPESRIHPEKITHPVQLMAAWFVLLVLLDSVLLTAAAYIDNPTWVAGFLAISSIVLAILIMLAVFLMLTRFRPHLQGSKEYAEWLKDKSRREGGKTAELEVSFSQEIEKLPDNLPQPNLDDVHLFREIASHPVEVSFLPSADQLCSALRQYGFRADIYRENTMSPGEINKNSDQTAIWIGSRVPARVVLLAIKTAVIFLPHLRYIHLSKDTTSDPPDFIHNEIFLGGATETAQEYGLLPWTQQEILELPEDITITDLHKLIRKRYAQ